jgi:hypothetical protein
VGAATRLWSRSVCGRATRAGRDEVRENLGREVLRGQLRGRTSVGRSLVSTIGWVGEVAGFGAEALGTAGEEVEDDLELLGGVGGEQLAE